LTPITHPLARTLVAAALVAWPAGAFAQPQAPSSSPADSLAPVGEADPDHDGIPDAIDACPTEPETYNDTQDDDGCPDATLDEIARRGPIRAVVPLIGRRLQVAPEVTQVLDLIVRLLRREPGILELSIEGHTDARGADAWNLLLSQARANYVREALIARGVDPRRVVAVGLGEQCPAVPGVGAAVWQRNRRVRFVVTRSTSPRWPAERVGCAASRGS
jgi:OmpA-OmpF porin, OOP family